MKQSLLFGLSFSLTESGGLFRMFFEHLLVMGIPALEIQDKPCLSVEGDGIRKAVGEFHSPRFAVTLICFASCLSVRSLSGLAKNTIRFEVT
jgi:hypothetical protein